MTPDGEDGDSIEGTYVLAIELTHPADIAVGSLGEVHFDPGGFAYVGSAFGPGGFSRLDRHRVVASGDHDVRHWHIDYLLAAEAATLSDVYRIPGRDRECVLASRLGETMIPDFGASDCQCQSHLAQFPTVRSLQQAVVQEVERCSG